jgi:hypothetical protein
MSRIPNTASQDVPFRNMDRLSLQVLVLKHNCSALANGYKGKETKEESQKKPHINPREKVI